MVLSTAAGEVEWFDADADTYAGGDEISSNDAITWVGQGLDAVFATFMQPRVLVGQGVVNSDSSDGVPTNGLGTWEVTVEPLVDGGYNITTEVEDLAGNITASALPPLMITVDGTPPQRPGLDLPTANDHGMMNNDNVTNSPLPGAGTMVPFRISSEDAMGTTVVVKDGNTVIFGPVEFASIPGQANNQATIMLNLAEGTHLLSVESIDMAGNISHQSEELVVEIDRTAPADDVTIAMAATSQTGVLNGSVVTNKMQPAFVGTTEANAKVRVYAVNKGMLGSMPNRVLIGQGVATSQGNWEITVEPLVNGHYTITVDVEDLAGNVTMASDMEMVVVDPYEPNNSVADATDLGSETETILNDVLLHDQTDTDLYKITAHNTGKMVIDVGQAAAGSFVLTFHDSAGGLLVTDGGASDTDGLENGKLVVPVVRGQTYIVQVANDLPATDAGNNPLDTKNFYDLEIENFMAPVPTSLVLNPADDSGMSNMDDTTSQNSPTMFVQVDLNDFEDMGIAIDGAPGADVQVTYAGISTGTTMTVDATRLAAGNLWTAVLPNLSDDLYFVNATGHDCRSRRQARLQGSVGADNHHDRHDGAGGQCR